MTVSSIVKAGRKHMRAGPLGGSVAGEDMQRASSAAESSKDRSLAFDRFLDSSAAADIHL